MKRLIRWGAPFFILGFVGIQFISTNQNQNDKMLRSDFSKVYSLPDNINTLFKISCYDCHSNYTDYPWYNIQPISWLMESHITEGKAELNFSEFGLYSSRRRKSKLRSIVNQINKNQMPIPQYLFLHPNAKLSEQNKEKIINWLETVIEAL